jgi:YcxB-like protein
METPFRGQIDAEILRRANRTALTLSPRTLILGGIVALVVIGGQVVPWLHGDTISWEGIGPVLVFVLFLAGLFGYSLYGEPRRILQDNALLQYSIVGEAKESGIRMETEHTLSELPWDVFFKRKIGKDIVLLYQSIEVVDIFPREFFATETDWEAFVDLVYQHVPDAAPRGHGGSTGTFRIFWIGLAILIVVILLWSSFHR